MEVWVDHREKRADVWKFLQDQEEAAVSFKTLKVGDYMIPDCCVFERKSFLDFAESVKNGRMFEQAAGLVHCGLPAMIILEGMAHDIRSMRMRRVSVQGALITLSVIYKIPVLRSLKPAETAQLIRMTTRQIIARGKPYYYRKKTRSGSKRKQQFMMLQSLPGVGADRAQKLIEKFESVEDIVLAEIEDLAEVEGIGIKTAERIKRVVCESPPVYGFNS